MSDHTYIYLHGLCSSPGSNKRRFLQRKCAPSGVEIHAPELNVPSFEGLTITAQVEAVGAFLDQLQPSGQVVFIGSSFGGLISLLSAQANPDAVARLLLIAPTTRFLGHGLPALTGTTMEGWKETGYLEMLHYSDNRIHRLGYQLVEDSATYDYDKLTVPHPVLIVHGDADEVVPFQRSVDWSARHPNSRLAPIRGGDHSLGERLDEVWELSRTFLLADSTR